MNWKNYLRSLAEYFFTNSSLVSAKPLSVNSINTNRLFAVNRIPVIVALDNPGGNFRFEMTHAVLDARKKIKAYISLLRGRLANKHETPVLAIEKLDIIENLFEGIFIEFLDAPSINTGSRIEHFWKECKPLLRIIEDY